MNSVNVFKRYEQTENQFTNGLISILSLSTMDNSTFLASFLRDVLGLCPTNVIDTFRVLKGIAGTADGELCGVDCRILLESKIVSANLRQDQIEEHLKQLHSGSQTLKKLVLLTPDDSNSNYIRKYCPRDSDSILHAEWKRVYDFLKDFVREQLPGVFSELIRQFCIEIHDTVFKQDIAGIIQKIQFGDTSEVYAGSYIDQMRAGEWDRWNTPREYKDLDGTGRKLMLYDRDRQGITVEVEIMKVERNDLDPKYPWANEFAPGTLKFFEPAIPLSRIEDLEGFKNFRAHRGAFRKVTHQQYRKLTDEVAE